MGSAVGDKCIPELPSGVRAMIWTEKGGPKMEPYDWIMKKMAKEAVMERLKISVRAYEEVDWELHGSAVKQVKSRYRPQVLRGVWDEIPTQSKMMRNGYAKEINCKLCGEEYGVDHYAGCGHVGLAGRQGLLIGNLRSKMVALKVNPFLTYWLLETMRDNTPRLERVSPLKLEWKVRAAFDGQNMIGWMQVPKGRVTSKMVDVHKVNMVK